MNRIIRALMFLGLLSGVMAAPVGAQDEGPIEPLVPPPSAETGEPTQESIGVWFVELPSSPVADGGKRSTIEGEQRNFRSAAQAAGLQYTERFAFQTLWNGLSISVGPTQLGTLSRIPGVKALYPVEVIPLPATSPLADPELATALAMTGADVAQAELGFSGAGVRVAVMDTGVDYHHPDLGGCFGPGCRVVTGYDFVGDAFNANPSSEDYDPNPVPDPDPDDCFGHGTHVAGIIGAGGAVTGVAPGVTFGSYRVFGCEGSTTADIMLAAMERALADGMDVLNMSIGSAFQWPQYPTAQASNRMVNRGMVVVASIGNSGANGVYSTGAPGNADKVIGVASFDNTNVDLTLFTISPDDTAVGYSPAAAAPEPPTSGTFPMARTGTSASTADACSPLPAGSLAGYVVLIRRGTCTFHMKSLHAMNAGAVAVVLYNNVAGRFGATVAGDPEITIPVVAISDAEGVLIDSRLASGPVDLTWTDQVGNFVNPTGGLISSFSSYGLPPDLSFKPDLGAPGGLIRSTWPLEMGGYATISGTSMSSPHVAGGVALLLEARPSTPAQAVDEILQNSADPKPWWGNPGLGFLDNVHRQGAGMLDIDDAILATTRIEPSELALGESQAGPALRTLTVRNTGPSDITYNLSHAPALSTRGSTFAPVFVTGFASVAFSSPSLFVPAGGSAAVDVTITANPGLPERSQYGGYIVFTPQGGSGQTFRVPYAGFKGDYQSILALAPTSSAFPWLSKLTDCDLLRDLDCFAGGEYANQPGGATFTMAGTDVPYILVHLDHQVQYLRMEVVDANTNQSWHRAMDLDFLGRNSTSTSFFALPWDGTTAGGNQVYTVPDGQYLIVLTVLEALGDEGDPTHIESWTSPVITIDRP